MTHDVGDDVRQLEKNGQSREQRIVMLEKQMESIWHKFDALAEKQDTLIHNLDRFVVKVDTRLDNQDTCWGRLAEQREQYLSKWSTVTVEATSKAIDKLVVPIMSALMEHDKRIDQRLEERANQARAERIPLAKRVVESLIITITSSAALFLLAWLFYVLVQHSEQMPK